MRTPYKTLNDNDFAVRLQTVQKNIKYLSKFNAQTQQKVVTNVSLRLYIFLLYSSTKAFTIIYGSRPTSSYLLPTVTYAPYWYTTISTADEKSR